MKENILKKVTEDKYFETFKEKGISGIKASKSFLGKNGTITPLLKRLIKASLEGEIEAHVADMLNEE